MGKVMSVKVEYGRKIRPENFSYEYETAEAKAEILVAFTEDEDADIQTEVKEAFDIAVANVHERVGLAVPKITKPTKKTTAAKKTTPAKSTDEDEDGDDDDDIPQIRKNPEDRKPPAKKTTAKSRSKKAEVEDDEDGEPVIPANLDRRGKSKVDLDDGDEDPDADEDGDEDSPDEEITDGDLNKAIGTKIASLMVEGVEDGPDKVTELLKSYKPKGAKGKFTARQLKQPQRAQFLEELEELN